MLHTPLLMLCVWRGCISVNSKSSSMSSFFEKQLLEGCRPDLRQSVVQRQQPHVIRLSSHLRWLDSVDFVQPARIWRAGVRRIDFLQFKAALLIVADARLSQRKCP